jgi:hypothetical protein
MCRGGGAGRRTACDQAEVDALQLVVAQHLARLDLLEQRDAVDLEA